MKKLFAIVIAVSMFSGLYAGASFGLGGQYTLMAPSVVPDSDYSYPSIVADVMVDLIPLIALRMGLVTVDIKSDVEGGTIFELGTGVFGDVVVKIPMAGMVKPYIPIGFWYYNKYHDFDLAVLSLKGGVGAMMGFGGVNGYLEAGVNFANMMYGETIPLEDYSDLYYYIQGGIRVPVGM